MQKFKFFIDSKFSNWERSTFEIEAKNEEDAKQRAIEIFDSVNRGDAPELEEVDDLDNIEYLLPEENKGSPTEELIYLNDSFEHITIKTNIDE